MWTSRPAQSQEELRRGVSRAEACRSDGRREQPRLLRAGRLVPRSLPAGPPCSCTTASPAGGPRRVPVVAPCWFGWSSARDGHAPLHDLAASGLISPTRPGGPEPVGRVPADHRGLVPLRRNVPGRMPGQVSFRAAERISIERRRCAHWAGSRRSCPGWARTTRCAATWSRTSPAAASRCADLDDGDRIEGRWDCRRVGVEYRRLVGIAVEGSSACDDQARDQVNDVRRHAESAAVGAGLPHGGQLARVRRRTTVPDSSGISSPSTRAHPSTTEPCRTRQHRAATPAASASTPTSAPTEVTLERNMTTAATTRSRRRTKAVQQRRRPLGRRRAVLVAERDAHGQDHATRRTHLLPRPSPAASCRADAGCTAVLATAGRRRDPPARAPGGVPRHGRDHEPGGVARRVRRRSRRRRPGAVRNVQRRLRRGRRRRRAPCPDRPGERDVLPRRSPASAPSSSAAASTTTPRVGGGPPVDAPMVASPTTPRPTGRATACRSRSSGRDRARGRGRRRRGGRGRRRRRAPAARAASRPACWTRW